ncbi:MAG: hypothetical protein HQK60_16155 [Deltaproteobacteria bacterium]|nr:hypothetical protein [Deltaproteobacteria bacterium]
MPGGQPQEISRIKRFSTLICSSWTLIGTVGLLVLYFVYQRGADTNWDLECYHYYNGYALLHWRFPLDIMPAGFQTYFNPVPNLLTYIAYSSLPFPFDAWLITCVQLLCLPLLWLIGLEISRDLGYEKPGVALVLAFLLSLAAPVWMSELGTSFFSSTTAVFVLLSLLCCLRSVAPSTTPRTRDRYVALAGVSIGLAFSMKLSNGLFEVGLLSAIILPLAFRNIRQAIRSSLIFCIFSGVGFAINGWWYVYLAKEWGNPVFPLYNAIFKSSYFPPVNLGFEKFNFESISSLIKFLVSCVNGTARTQEIIFADARLLIFPVLLVICFLVLGVRVIISGRRGFSQTEGSVCVAFLSFCCVSFALWAKILAGQRYLIPVELVLGFAIWILAIKIYPNKKVISVVLALCIVVALVKIKVPNWGHYLAKNKPINHFGMQIPPELINQPANYLMYGFPNAFIIPYLHPDSRFYRLETDTIASPSSFAKLIHNALAKRPNYPLRLLTFKLELEAARSTAAKLGYPLPEAKVGSCLHFFATGGHNSGQYVSCEISLDTPGPVKIPTKNPVK